MGHRAENRASGWGLDKAARSPERTQWGQSTFGPTDPDLVPASLVALKFQAQNCG